MVSLNTESLAKARADVRRKLAETHRRPLSLAFEAWLNREEEAVAELAAIIDRASIHGGTDDPGFQTVAMLGFAASAGLLGTVPTETLRNGLAHVSGREPVVAGSPMAFRSDAVGLLGVSLGARTIADAEMMGRVARWVGSFLRTSYEASRAEDWQRCLFAAVDRLLNKPIGLPIPCSAKVADVRSVLRAKRLLDDLDRCPDGDTTWTADLSFEDLPADSDCDRIVLRLAAMELVIRTSMGSVDQIPTPCPDGFGGHNNEQMFVLDAPTRSMDRVLQADPIWTIRGTQEGPIVVTRLSGETVWVNEGVDDPDQSALTPDEELRIADVGLSARTELRREIEAAFAGAAWPLVSVIIEPFRQYAIKIFDVNAMVCRTAASKRGRDFKEVLSAMLGNLLSEVFGAEWERSPGDKVVRTDWQCGTDGWKGKEITVIAGNDPDPACTYHQVIGDGIRYRYRFHAPLPDPIPGQPPGINLSAAEWNRYIGLKERHNLAMAVKPYLEDRKAHWRSVHALRAPSEAIATTAVVESATTPVSRGAHLRNQRGKAKPTRRNVKYEGIDQALREISEARPKNHEEVFRFLDDRKILIPNRRPFKASGGWLKGFQQSRHAASVWLSQAWGRLGLPAFARGPKK